MLNQHPYVKPEKERANRMTCTPNKHTINTPPNTTLFSTNIQLGKLFVII